MDAIQQQKIDISHLNYIRDELNQSHSIEIPTEVGGTLKYKKIQIKENKTTENKSDRDIIVKTMMDLNHRKAFQATTFCPENYVV